MRTLIIDNYDSFTYILKQYFGQLGGNPVVFQNDKISINQIKKLKPTHIVLSPGPGTVDESKDVGIIFDVIREFHNKIPILGVCLGHQAICKYFGGKIVRAPKIMHGKRSKIFHLGKSVFKGVKNPLEAMRYHSLVVEDMSLDEVIYETKLTNPMISEVMKAKQVDKSKYIYCDSAEPKSIKELLNLGWRTVATEKGRDSILNGIQKMQSKDFLITNTSLNLIKEFRSYIWATDKAGKQLNTPIDAFNHGIDGVRYYFFMQDKYK